MRIKVHPDYLRQVAQVFSSQSMAVDHIGEELQRAISGLDTWAWDGQSRARAEPMLSRVWPESRQLAEQLEELGRKLQYAADAFEEVDTHAVPRFGDMPADRPPSIPSAWTGVQSRETPSAASYWLSYGPAAAWTWGGFALGQIPLLWEGVSAIRTAHRVLNAPTISGLSSNVWKDAWTLAQKGVRRAPKANLAFGLSILSEVVSEWQENWEEFHGDVLAVSTAVVVESALGIGCSIAGAGVGTLVGAATGSVLGPAGVVIGSKIGGIIGGYLGGEMAEWLE